MNKNLLHSVVVGQGENWTTLANALGLSRPTLSNKINNKVDFRSEEISFIRERYALSDEQLVSIFFAELVF